MSTPTPTQPAPSRPSQPSQPSTQPQQNQQQPEITIIGAGPCGLTLAALLERKSIPYTIYERDPSPTSNRAGGSLDIHAATGQLALREAGLFEDFLKLARYEDTAFSLARKDGTRVLTVAGGEDGEHRDAPEIDRFELREILLRGVDKGRVKWGFGLVGAELLSGEGEGGKGGVVLRFGNGEVVSVEAGKGLVVGADGAWSKLRGLVCVFFLLPLFFLSSCSLLPLFLLSDSCFSCISGEGFSFSG
jgi:2-polyprenyl-6-methoxyphenol hydroxylase-like FAD-dependent oxidoreductase